MDLEGYNDYIVFYTQENRENKLQHLIGFSHKPDVTDVQDALTEWQTEVEPKMNLTVPVYMIFLPRDAIMDLFGIGG
jgi:hypothetical protein